MDYPASVICPLRRRSRRTHSRLPCSSDTKVNYCCCRTQLSK